MPTNFEYSITKTAKEDLDKLTPAVRERIGKKLQYIITTNEPLKFAEKLISKRDGDYRFRVGDYRVVFILKGTTIYLIRVQHRREVYRSN